MDNMDYAREKKELSLMRQIYATLMSFSKKLEKQDSRCGQSLTARQFLIVLAVRCAPGKAAAMVWVAKKLGTTKQNINQMIPVLEKKGYVCRVADGNCKKATRIQATDAGLRAMLEYAATGAAFIADVFDSLTEQEMETLLCLLRKLHGYDGTAYIDSESDMLAMFEGEYADTLSKILEEHSKRK